MRHALVILLSPLFLCSAGCMTCHNGLCSPNEPEAIFDRNLLGEWAPIDPKPRKGDEGYFKVERDDPNSSAYRVSIISVTGARESGEPAVFKAYLTKLGDSFFLDAIDLLRPESQRGLPRHAILKIDIKMPEITIWALSEDFVRGHPDAIRSKVERSWLGFEKVLVTATTGELRDFLREHAHKPAAWREPKMVLRHQ